MSSTVGSMKNVKIFVLYLMENVGKPLDFVTLNDIVMQTDYIMYLDFAEAFHKMLDDDLIAEAGVVEGDTVYEITERGRNVAETLHSDILSSILDKSLAAALRYLDFKQRGIEGKCRTARREDGRYELYCELSERVDPSLIGGVRVMVEGRLYDGSVSGKLTRFKRRLKELSK